MLRSFLLLAAAGLVAGCAHPPRVLDLPVPDARTAMSGMAFGRLLVTLGGERHHPGKGGRVQFVKLVESSMRRAVPASGAEEGGQLEFAEDVVLRFSVDETGMFFIYPPPDRSLPRAQSIDLVQIGREGRERGLLTRWMFEAPCPTPFDLRPGQAVYLGTLILDFALPDDFETQRFRDFVVYHPPDSFRRSFDLEEARAYLKERIPGLEVGGPVGKHPYVLGLTRAGAE